MTRREAVAVSGHASLLLVLGCLSPWPAAAQTTTPPPMLPPPPPTPPPQFQLKTPQELLRAENDRHRGVIQQLGAERRAARDAFRADVAACARDAACTAAAQARREAAMADIERRKREEQARHAAIRKKIAEQRDRKRTSPRDPASPPDPDPVCTDPALTDPIRAMLCGATDMVR